MQHCRKIKCFLYFCVTLSVLSSYLLRKLSRCRFFVTSELWAAQPWAMLFVVWVWKKYRVQHYSLRIIYIKCVFWYPYESIFHFHSRKYHLINNVRHDSSGIEWCLVTSPTVSMHDSNKKERNFAWIHIYFSWPECMCEPKSTSLYMTRQSLLNKTRALIKLEMLKCSLHPLCNFFKQNILRNCHW